MEHWNDGRLGKSKKSITHHSIFPLFHSSHLPFFHLYYQKSLELSSRIVTGPKLTSSTSIEA